METTTDTPFKEEPLDYITLKHINVIANAKKYCHIWLNQADCRWIINEIRNQRSIPLYKISNAKRVHHLIFRHQDIFVVYNGKKRWISKFIERESLDKEAILKHVFDYEYFNFHLDNHPVEKLLGISKEKLQELRNTEVALRMSKFKLTPKNP